MPDLFSRKVVGWDAADHLRAVLAGHDIEPSMSRKGDGWDNAVAESFIAPSRRS